MPCQKCGAVLEVTDTFCPSCGEPAAPAPAPVSTVPPAEPAAPKKKKSKKKWIVISAILALLLIAAVVLAVIFVPMFPASFTVRGPEDLTTQNGLFEEITVQVQTNQPISDIRYAVNPADPDDPSSFTSVSYTESDGTATVTLRDISVPPGTAPLYIYVKTWFDQHTALLTMNYDIGHISAPLEEDIIELEDGLSIVGNELEICFKEGTSPETAKAIIEAYGGEIIGQVYFLDQYQARFDSFGEDALADLVFLLEGEPEVELVSYSILSDAEIFATPNDSEFDTWDVSRPAGNNWGQECINAPGAWDHLDRMSTVKIGVIDSALDYDHEDLQIDPTRIHMLATDDFLTGESLHDYYNRYKDTHVCSSIGCSFCSLDHGTHVSGIIGAVYNNNTGIAGVCPTAQLEFASAWYCYESTPGDIYMASTYDVYEFQIVKLAMSGCRVINMSLGERAVSAENDFERRLTAKFDRTFRKLEENGYDFVITKAAGNENQNAADYRFNRILTNGAYTLAHTIIVGALEHHDVFWEDATQYAVARYSNFGEIVDIAAPGSDIYSTVFDTYASYDGTSMAAPNVAGVAGLLYSVNPSLTCDEVKSILRSQTEQFTAKNGTVYPIVDANLAVNFVLENGGGTPEVQLPSAGYVTGLIQDAKTEELIMNAAVFVTNAATGERMAATVSEGSYYMYLESGVYDLEFVADGYHTETIFNVAVEEGIVSYNVLLNMVEDTVEQGRATGSIIDAFDASHIPYATIRIYKGVNNTIGDPLTTITADGNGEYEVTLDPGNYTVYAGAEGYTNGTATILVLPDETTYDQNCTLTPTLLNGEFRVVLTWGKYPLDLDSHLTGPTPTGSRFHTFWPESKRDYIQSGKTYVNLDVDDRSSYGPETTSVYIPVNGTYTYYVHDYSNRNDSYSAELANSGAQIKVYVAGREEPYIFNVPPYDGTLWEVFRITNGELVPVNSMSYESSSPDVGQ